MSVSVQELIGKIKAEGIDEARAKAVLIEQEAREKAAGIVADAQMQAGHIVAEGEAAVRRFEESARTSVGQAARAAVLSLQQEIQAMLKRVAFREAAAVLTGDRLAAIVESMARTAASGAVISLNEQDIETLRSGMLAKLQEEFRGRVTFAPRRDRARGLTVSFDQGRSCVDLTDAEVADFLASFAAEDLAAIIRG